MRAFGRRLGAQQPPESPAPVKAQHKSGGFLGLPSMTAKPRIRSTLIILSAVAAAAAIALLVTSLVLWAREHKGTSHPFIRAHVNPKLWHKSHPGEPEQEDLAFIWNAIQPSPDTWRERLKGLLCKDTSEDDPPRYPGSFRDNRCENVKRFKWKFVVDDLSAAIDSNDELNQFIGSPYWWKLSQRCYPLADSDYTNFQLKSLTRVCDSADECIRIYQQAERFGGDLALTLNELKKYDFPFQVLTIVRKMDTVWAEFNAYFLSDLMYPESVRIPGRKHLFQERSRRTISGCTIDMQWEKLLPKNARPGLQRCTPLGFGNGVYVEHIDGMRYHISSSHGATLDSLQPNFHEFFLAHFGNTRAAHDSTFWHSAPMDCYPY
jgi:hypothetical protein